MSSLLSCVNVKSYFHAVKGHKVKMHVFLTLWWCRSMEEKEKRKNTMSLNEFNIFCIFHFHQVFLIVDVLITSFSIRCWNPALQNLLFRLCYCRNTSQQQCKNEQQQSERLLLLFLQQLRQMLIWFSSKKKKKRRFSCLFGVEKKIYPLTVNASRCFAGVWPCLKEYFHILEFS